LHLTSGTQNNLLTYQDEDLDDRYKRPRDGHSREAETGHLLA